MYKEIRKILFAIIFAFSFSGNSKAQNYVLIPDANFATYLQGLIPNAMNGSSLNITSTLVTIGTQTMIPQNLGISNIIGIQYFTSLTYLDCSWNSLTSLPTLPNSLIYLDCSYNPLISSPTLPNALQTLYCRGNSLASLPTLPNSLITLKCSQNPITSLPILPNSLVSLECCNCYSLTSLPALPNSLTSLVCCICSLTSIPSLPSSLTTLHCFANSIASLPALPNSISYLNCSKNSITSLPTLPNSLTYLDCSYNSLNSLPTLPNTLTYLHCDSNKVVCFPSFPSSITNIDLKHNPFTCLPNYVLPAMSDYTNTPICAGPCTTGVREFSLNNQINIYPNPNNGSFKIQIDDEIDNAELLIFNSLGQRMHEQRIIKGENSIHKDKVSSGLYHFIILQNKQQISSGKLIIE